MSNKNHKPIPHQREMQKNFLTMCQALEMANDKAEKHLFNGIPLTHSRAKEISGLCQQASCAAVYVERLLAGCPPPKTGEDDTQTLPMPTP